MQRPSSDWLGLSGARVLVAGAGGIGAACAEGFAGQGAQLLVVDRDAERLGLVAKEIGDAHPEAVVETLAIDLTDPGAGATAVERALDLMGGLDVLIHAIGVNDRRPVLDFTVEEWEKVLRVNLGSAFGLAQAAGRHMVAARHGRVVMLSSVSGLLAHAKHGPYATSKGGLNQMVRVMAREWAASDVTVNAVAPGYVETNLTAAYLSGPGIREGLTELVPAGRLGTAAEVVGPVLFLASSQAAFVNGQILYIDGGRTLV